MTDLLVIDAAGTNYEIGFIVGRAARKQLERSLAAYRRILPADGINEPWQLPLSYLNAAREAFPHLVEELQGMADGSGIAFSDLFFLNALEEALDINKPKACTAVGIIGVAGETWFGHNEDWYADDRESVIAIRAHPKDKPAFISITAAPFLAAVGINEAGLAQGVNSVDSIDNRPGVPRMFAARAVLEAESLNAAYRIACPEGRAGGYNHLLVSADGRLANLETTATEHDLLDGDQVIYHTNHYLSNKLSKLAAEPGKHSKTRYLRLEELKNFMLNNNKVDDTLKKVLSDHRYRPFSICRHAAGQEEQDATIFSMIGDLKELNLWVAVGNPCASQYRKLTFTRNG